MIENLFLNLSQTSLEEYSPAVWAYVGDAVYELFIRCHLTAKGPARTRNLHHEAVTMVKASFQAKALFRIEPWLRPEELEIIKRGRNVKCGHVPSGSDCVTYRHSTAFEALIGYLYLSGQSGRLAELLNKTTTSDGDDENVKS